MFQAMVDYAVKNGIRQYVTVTSVALALIAAGSGLSVAVTSSWQLVLLWGVLIGLGTAAHQAFSSNIFALISDLYPRRAVATVADSSAVALTSGRRNPPTS